MKHRPRSWGLFVRVHKWLELFWVLGGRDHALFALNTFNRSCNDHY